MSGETGEMDLDSGAFALLSPPTPSLRCVPLRSQMWAKRSLLACRRKRAVPYGIQCSAVQCSTRAGDRRGRRLPYRVGSGQGGRAPVKVPVPMPQSSTLPAALHWDGGTTVLQ